MLKAWRRRQAARRLGIGPLWADSGLVFTADDGRPWHPDVVTDRFERLAFRAHLPPVRLHDVRHFNITQLYAAKVSERVISERVGHSGSKMTRDYAAVAAEVSREAAERVVAAIPRKARRL
jgi:integrase